MTGIHLEGVKYLVPLAQETLIFGKKGKGGVFVAKTNTGKSLILIFVLTENDLFSFQLYLSLYTWAKRVKVKRAEVPSKE